MIMVSMALIAVAGCATTLHPLPAGQPVRSPVVFGRIHTVLLAPSNRWYVPQLDAMELHRMDTGERFEIEMQPPEEWFTVALPAGRYEVMRVRVQEGPFRSIATIGMQFAVAAETVTYVGDWRIGIEAPQQGRMILISAVADRGTAWAEFRSRHPGSTEEFVTSLPDPTVLEERLYEVEPYPRYRYFRRHWW
jgi:hypothetical protein